MHGRQQTHIDAAAAVGRGVVNKAGEVWLADWKAHGLSYCSVYIVTPDSEWPCKVGISTCAYKRLMSLQTSVWRPLKVARCYWTATVHEARQVEKKMHDTLSDMGAWMHGEWFDMKPDRAAELLEFNAEILGIEVHSEIIDAAVVESVENRVMGTFNNPLKRKRRIDARYPDTA